MTDKRISQLNESMSLANDDIFLVSADDESESQYITENNFKEYAGGIVDSVKILLNPVGVGIPKTYTLTTSIYPNYINFPIGDIYNLPLSVVYTNSNENVNVDEAMGVITLKTNGLYWITSSISIRVSGDGETTPIRNIGKVQVGDVSTSATTLPCFFYYTKRTSSFVIELVACKTDFVYYKNNDITERLNYYYVGSNLAIVWPGVSSGTGYDISTNYINIAKLR